MKFPIYDLRFTRWPGVLCALCVLCVPAFGQFRRSSDSNAYPYVASPSGSYTYIVANPGSTNYNYAFSNQWATATNIAAYQSYLSTNGWTATATNIAAYQAFLATNNYASTATNIASYQSFLSTNNFLGQNLRYPTNQASTATMDVGNKYTGLATNNNVTLTGCANVDSTGTNISWGILTVTNTAGSGAVKTIAIPAAWVDIDNLGGTTIYNTNQGVLSVMVYPNLGTNFIWRGK